jgi:hypothetical protein
MILLERPLSPCPERPQMTVARSRKVLAFAMVLGVGSGCMQGQGEEMQLSAAVLPRILWAVGRALGEPQETFGHIQDAQLTPDGRLLVLDNSEGELSEFLHTGEFVRRSFGRGASRRGFSDPVSLSFDESGHIAVLDRSLGELRYLTDVSGELLTTRAASVPFDATSLCHLGDEVYYLLPREIRGIRAVDARGEETRSWLIPIVADSVRRENAQYAHRWQSGRLLCDVAGNRVVFVAAHTGDVIAFSPTGKVLWRTRLLGFRARQWHAVKTATGFTMESVIDAHSPFDEVTHATLSSGDVAVTVRKPSQVFQSAAPPSRPARYEFHLISATGHAAEPITSLGNVVGALGDTVFGYRDLGIPELLAWMRPRAR